MLPCNPIVDGIQLGWLINSDFQKNENLPSHLRRSDALLQMPCRVPALHVRLRALMERRLDHRRAARALSTTAGQSHRAQPLRPAAHEPEPRAAFQRR